jgi:O-antigen/teichoic acid export membrane protein
MTLRSRIRETIWPSTLDAAPFASTAAANAAIAVCGLASGTLLARTLGPEGRGELAAIQAWPLLLATVGSFGLAEAVAYFAATTPHRARTALSSALLLSLPSSAIAVALGFWILDWALQSQGGHVRQAAKLSLVLVPLMTFVTAPYQALRGAGRCHASNVLRLIPPAGWVAALAAIALSGEPTATTTAAAFIVVMSLSAAASHIYVWRALEGRPLPAAPLVRPMLTYGAPTALSNLPQWLNIRLDQLVMIAVLAPQSVGLYVVAVAWGGAAQPLSMVLAYLAVPALAAAPDGHHKAQLVYRSGAVVSIAASVVLLAATPIVLPLVFGEQFRAAIPAALVMVVAGAVSGMNAVGGECLRGLGRPQGVLFAECAGLAVACVAVPVAILTGGILGAAVASLLSCVTILLVQRRLISTTTPSTIDSNLVLALDPGPR